MIEKSGILFLAICSQTKNEEFDTYCPLYSSDRSVLTKLSSTGQSLLLKERNFSRKLLKESNFKVGSKLLSELSWNKSLVKGPDFDGTEKGKYLPALDVYRGGFYRSLGPDGIQSIRNSPHHVLIISGLYGLLLPDELIQIYESPLEDFSAIQEIWQENNALTEILLDYLLSNNVKMIINLSSQLAYIHLIDWGTLSYEYFKTTKHDLKILYGTHEIMKGPEALKILGDVLGSKLISMNEQDLVALNDGDMIKSIKFSKKRDYEREVEIQSLIRGRAWEELFGLSKYEKEYKEFKPALVDLTEDSERSIEQECFEVIAAFLNTKGGVLFIGVDKDGEKIGVDQLYPNLSFFSNRRYPLPVNQDGFSLLFEEFFKKYIGEEHYGKVILDFWETNGKDIAVVGISKKSSTPIYVKDPKTGTSLYFIRGIGSTLRLEGGKLRRYIEENSDKPRIF